MEKDAKRLLELYEAFDDILRKFCDVGELDDWDRNQEVDKVYKGIEDL